MTRTLRARWLGLVPYRDAEALQRAIHERNAEKVQAQAILGR